MLFHRLCSDMFGYKFWNFKNKRILRHCIMTFDENVLYKDKKKKGSGTTKQVGVVEKFTLPVAYTQETSETVAEEPKVEQVTPEPVLRRSSKTIKVPDRYVPLLHYLLLTDEMKPEPFVDALQLDDTTKWEQVMNDEMSQTSRLQNYVAPNETEYMAIADAGKEMIGITDYLEELVKKQRMKILYTDSQSVIQLVKNSIYRSKTKHIRRRYHFTHK